MLAQPRANLYDVVIADNSGCIVSKKAVEQRGADFGIKPVGSGRITDALERQKGGTLRRHAGYAGRKPRFEEIGIRYLATRAPPISRCARASSTSPFWRRPRRPAAPGRGSRSATSRASLTYGSA